MQRQRGELVPIAEALADMPGPVKALRETPPPARRGFTVADQVDRLVWASEADPDRGFLARTMALCSLPRSNPGNRKEYKRVNGPFTLGMSAGLDNKLPFGTNPRLILSWLCTEVVRTGSREIVLGRSLSTFMRKLGIASTNGRTQARLRNQMDRLFNCSVSMIYKDEHGKATVNSLIALRTEFWWTPKHPNQTGRWESKVTPERVIFQRDCEPSGPTRSHHPQGTQTLSARLGSLPVAHLSNVCFDNPTTALLAAGLPSVRRTPG